MEKGKLAQKEVAKAAASALDDTGEQGAGGGVAGGEVGGDKEAGDKEAGEQGAGGGGAGSGEAAVKQISVRVTWEVADKKHLYGQVYQLVKQDGATCTLRGIGSSGGGISSHTIPAEHVLEVSPNLKLTDIVNLQNKTRPYKKDALQVAAYSNPILNGPIEVLDKRFKGPLPNFCHVELAMSQLVLSFEHHKRSFVILPIGTMRQFTGEERTEINKDFFERFQELLKHLPKHRKIH